MRGCRHSGVRLIVPPRRAAAPTRVTCRYLRKDKLPHPPPLMEGEALASRILELGPVGAKFLGPVMIEVPHFASLRGAEREIVILRSDNGEAWREHTVEASEEVVQEILGHSFEKEDMPPPVEADPTRLTRILTLDFPHYFAVVSRVKQEVHAIGPEGGMVSSSVVPQVQAVFPQGALTKKIKVGLQAQPIPTDITAKLLGNRVAVSPIVTIEPRRRKFHKPITLTIPVPQAANKGMINQYSGDAPTLRLLCSITGGTARAQWEDVTGTTPLTFVKDCVSFTTTVSARFWLMDCRNVQDSAKMATELYREAIHVPFLAKFVVFAKRIEQLEARLRVFCMTDDKEEKTLEQQEHFTEVAKSRDVEVLEGKSQFVEFAGNLVPVTKSGDQLRLGFRAFRENRLPFTVRVKDPHADVIGRTLFMREPKVSKGEAPQQPICVLNIVLPEEIIPETIVPDSELTRYQYLTHSSGLESYERTELRLSDISKLLENDWIPLASNLGISNSDICRIETDHPGNEAQQAMAMLKLWMKQSSNRPSAATLESALVNIGREDIIQKCIHSSDASSDPSSLVQRDYPDSSSSPFRTTEFVQVPRAYCTNIKDEESDRKLLDQEDLTYEIKESNIIEEPSKPVAEHRREIEKRLSQERSFSLEKPEKKSEELKMRTKKTEHITLTETEAKDEPELSFHDKRLSFERGSSQERAKTDVFIQEEKKSSIITSLPLDTAEVKVDEAAKLSFREKRKSFEQGSLDKPEKDDKKPKYVDGKISEIRDDVRKIQTVSETIETIGDKESIVSENVTKITGKSDKKPLTTERVTTTTQVVSEEKPITSKSIEEKNIVTISGAKDTSENPVSKTLVNEVVGTSLERDPKYDMKAKVETSKTVNETITVNTDSKPLDEITVSVGSPKEKSAVSEIVTTLISGDNITKEIINIEINKEKPVISETITTVISDSKPIVENIKDTPIIKSKKTVIPDIEPGTDTKAFTEVITSVTTDKGPFEQAKAMTENLFKTEPKETEPIVLSSTKTGDDSRTITNTVRESVIVKSDGKPTDQTQIILETTKPYSSEKIDTIKGDNKLLVSETIKSVTETGKPTEEIKTNLHKGLEQAVKEQIMAKEVDGKDFLEEISNTKPQQFLKDEICTTTESNIISEIVTTKNIKGTPSETKTVTEITRKSSDITKPDQQTIITEISAGKPDMSLEERRKSELFEGVTQGLLANVKYQEPNSKDIISPKLINTPPPSPADFKDATSVSSTTEPSWTSSTTLTDKTAIFIESERGPKPTGKSLQDSHEESKAPTSILKNNSESLDINEHDSEAENIGDDITAEGKSGESSEHKKGKRKRKRGKGKKNQQISLLDEETEITTDIQSKIDLLVDENPVTTSENINIIENIVDKKGKKKSKKESKEISQELMNATNIATTMILRDPKGKNDSEIGFSKEKLEPTIEKQIQSSDITDILNTDKVNAMPIITEVIPKKFDSASKNHKSDFSPSISDGNNLTGSSNVVNLFAKDNDQGSSKNHHRNVIEESQSLTMSDVFIEPIKTTMINEEPEKYDRPAMASFMDSFGLHSSEDTVDCSQKGALVTSDKMSAEIPEEFLESKISSEIITSELPDKIPGKVIGEKNSSEIPDVINGMSKITVEKITTEIPHEIEGISKIITEKITTEMPHNIDVSKVVTEKITTKMNDFDNDLQNIPSYLGEMNKTESLQSLTQRTLSRGSDSINSVQSAAEEEELTNLEETNEISTDRFNDIIKSLSTSSREDIEQLLAGTLSQDPGTQDEKLTNLLIDMLIEQETMKLAASGDLPEVLDSEGSDMEGTINASQTQTISDNDAIDSNNKIRNSHQRAELGNEGTKVKKDNVLKTMIKENSEPVLTTLTDLSGEIYKADGNVSPKPYVTTPTLSRRGIGGSQRYSREERPMLIEVTKRYASSSDEEDENSTSDNIQYVVTEPSPTVIKRKVTFKFDSEDLMSEDQDEDERVHFELVGEIKDEQKKENPEPLKIVKSNSTECKRNSIEIPKFDDLETVEKVERKFERMASETLEDNSLAKGAVEGEFQRLTSQLSHEEMDECLMIWNESDLVSMDETKSEHVEFEDEVEDSGELENRDEPSSSQGSRQNQRPSLKYDISMDEEPEYDPREHDWRFDLPIHSEKEESPELDIKESNDVPKKK